MCAVWLAGTAGCARVTTNEGEGKGNKKTTDVANHFLVGDISPKLMGPPDWARSTPWPLAFPPKSAVCCCDPWFGGRVISQLQLSRKSPAKTGTIPSVMRALDVDGVDAADASVPSVARLERRVMFGRRSMLTCSQSVEECRAYTPNERSKSHASSPVSVFCVRKL